MQFIQEQNRIYTTDASGKMIAEVVFPDVDEGAVEITRTFVDDILRGQGVAGKLMEAVAERLRAESRQAVLTCSYAVKWFGQHPEYGDVVKKVQRKV